MMPPAVVGLANELESRLKAHGIELTMGGEPTYVPEDCAGAEWNITAVGATKLARAKSLARALIADILPGAIAMFSPGKLYPGETNPRWVVNLLWSPGETPLAPAPTRGRKPTGPALAAMKDAVASRLGLPAERWLRAVDPLLPHRPVWILPLDHQTERGGWYTDEWSAGPRARRLRLLAAEGPSGLRLPLAQLPAGTLRRALVLEIREGAVTCFLPPLLHAPFRELLAILTSELSARGLGGTDRHLLEGYLPVDLDPHWGRLGLTADPGVLEVNLPPCATWHDYERWLRQLEVAAQKAGLRSWKMDAFRGVQTGQAAAITSSSGVRPSRPIPFSLGRRGSPRFCVISRRIRASRICSPVAMSERPRRRRGPMNLAAISTTSNSPTPCSPRRDRVIIAN